jgi:indolepyruvate decarboxylase
MGNLAHNIGVAHHALLKAQAPKYTVSNYILDRLKELNIRHFFEVPGDYASIFLNTLDNDPDIQRIGNINELGVGYATDGYGRFNGAAACSVQYGVGTFCIVNGFAGGYVERVPMVLIGPSPSTNARKLTATEGILFHHSTGNLAADKLVMENVTVASVVLSEGATAPALVDAALTAMLTHRKPVYIEVYQNVFGEACTPPVGKLSAIEASSEATSLAAILDAAWEAIQQAKLPVIWAGVEIQRYGLQGLLQQIVDASGLFFTTTSLGKTVLDETQKQFIGTFAGPASPAATRAVMEATDLPIALGTIITDDYLDIMASDYGKMILVDDETARVGYAQYSFVTMKDFMQGLLERFQSAANYPRKFRLPKHEPERRPQILGSQSMTYERFYYELGDWLIKQGNIVDAKLILGESTSLYVFGNLMGMPQDSFVAQAAWGSLGHETGCAIGVELATGQRPIVVAGDGGFMMICQEISTMVRNNSNAIVFVMSNTGYTIEQSFVDICAFTPSGKFAPFDLLPTWDYTALAKAFGAKGYVVENVRQLRNLLRKLKTRDGVPSLVEVKIPLKDLPPQMYRLAMDPPQPPCKEDLVQF